MLGAWGGGDVLCVGGQGVAGAPTVRRSGSGVHLRNSCSPAHLALPVEPWCEGRAVVDSKEKGGAEAEPTRALATAWPGPNPGPRAADGHTAVPCYRRRYGPHPMPPQPSPHSIRGLAGAQSFGGRGGGEAGGLGPIRGHDCPSPLGGLSEVKVCVSPASTTTPS